MTTDSAAGVLLFFDTAPDKFGGLYEAFDTVFCIALGASKMESFGILTDIDGRVNGVAVVFFCSLVLFKWILWMYTISIVMFEPNGRARPYTEPDHRRKLVLERIRATLPPRAACTGPHDDHPEPLQPTAPSMTSILAAI